MLTTRVNHRVVDLILFSIGDITQVDKAKIDTFYDSENKDQNLFLVPKDTKILDYNPVEENDDGKTQQQKEMDKMKMREELIRGYRI